MSALNQKCFVQEAGNSHPGCTQASWMDRPGCQHDMQACRFMAVCLPAYRMLSVYICTRNLQILQDPRKQLDGACPPQGRVCLQNRASTVVFTGLPIKLIQTEPRDALCFSQGSCPITGPCITLALLRPRLQQLCQLVGVHLKGLVWVHLRSSALGVNDTILA